MSLSSSIRTGANRLNHIHSQLQYASSSTMSHSCCFSGYFHKGTPKGSVSQFGPHNVDTYITGPEPDQASGAILFICDVFGISLNNNRVIAGANTHYYAQHTGARVYVPDFFDKRDAFTQLNGLPMNAPENKDVIPKFLAEFNPRANRSFELARDAARAIKQAHPGKKLAVIGFCWGAPASMHLGSEDPPVDSRADAVGWAHPSLIEVPGDLKKLTKPGVFLTCEKDPRLSSEQRHTVEEEMNKLAEKQIYTTLQYFPGVSHGWSIRGDEQNEFVARAARDAHRTASDFFSVEFRGNQ
ncbi:hypothetical protein OC845_002466 [Tilletia horrida]|nr:hypothetical protein OC845_002466 [Tilletia horrida]